MRRIKSRPGRNRPKKIKVSGQTITVRSGAEERVARDLERKNIPFEHESLRFPYVVEHEYIPDFVLPNGVVVEVKGWTEGWASGADRKKMLRVREAHPEIDLRIVWSSDKFANGRIRPGSKTTNEEWARKNGFMTAVGTIPASWVE